MTHWPRWLEIAVGLWLIMSSPIIEPVSGLSPAFISEVILGSGVAVVAAVSMKKEWERLHWVAAPLALWVTLVPYFHYEGASPPLAQSDITAGLILLMLFILPTRALDPPDVWQDIEGKSPK